MEDDTKLKIIFAIIVILFAVICVGVWEMALKPLIDFIRSSINF